MLAVTEGCVGLTSIDTSASPSPSLLTPAPPTPLPPTPQRTPRQCEPNDARPRCATPTPIAPTMAPTDSPTAAPTDTPSPTVPPTATPTPRQIPTGGTGGVDTDIAVSTTQLDFGNVVSGATALLPVTLTNTGSDPFGPINMFGGAPPSTEFNASQNCQSTTLPAGGSCTVNYSFSPPAPGTYLDFSSFTISETASQSDGEDITVALFGCGETC
jgi:hypothetical protein